MLETIVQLMVIDLTNSVPEFYLGYDIEPCTLCWA